jgi:hypothetical protein
MESSECLAHVLNWLLPAEKNGSAPAREDLTVRNVASRLRALGRVVMSAAGDAVGRPRDIEGRSARIWKTQQPHMISGKNFVSAIKNEQIKDNVLSMRRSQIAP